MSSEQSSEPARVLSAVWHGSSLGFRIRVIEEVGLNHVSLTLDQARELDALAANLEAERRAQDSQWEQIEEKNAAILELTAENARLRNAIFDDSMTARLLADRDALVARVAELEAENARLRRDQDELMVTAYDSGHRAGRERELHRVRRPAPPWRGEGAS